jgi:hypothetical protein
MRHATLQRLEAPLRIPSRGAVVEGGCGSLRCFTARGHADQRQRGLRFRSVARGGVGTLCGSGGTAVSQAIRLGLRLPPTVERPCFWWRCRREEEHVEDCPRRPACSSVDPGTPRSISLRTYASRSRWRAAPARETGPGLQWTPPPNAPGMSVSTSFGTT